MEWSSLSECLSKMKLECLSKMKLECLSKMKLAGAEARRRHAACLTPVRATRITCRPHAASRSK